MSCLALALALISGVGGPKADLLEGVRAIASPGSPGTVGVIGPSAFALAYGRQGRLLAPVAGAGTLGKGKVIVFGHSGYLGAFGVHDTGRLLVNGVRWSGSGRTAIVVRVPGLSAWLNRQGVSSEERASAESLDPAKHCLIMSAEEIRSEKVEELKRFVELGGGLITAATGWGWQQLNGEKPLTELPANRVLMGAGLLVTGGFANAPEPGRMLPVAGPEEALSAWHGLLPLRQNPEGGSAQDSQLAVAAFACLPAGPHPFRSEVQRLVSAARSKLTFPVAASETRQRLALSLMVQEAGKASPLDMEACPTASVFPGAVPGAAPRPLVKAQLPAGQEGWLSTGLYAPPGGKVTVSVGQTGWQARIGAHTDALWHLEKWERAPEVSRVFLLNSSPTVIGSAYGGLIYLIPPRKTDLPTEAAIQGAVKAPRFKLGETTAAEWEKARLEPGPWAEIEGQRVIHTIPSEWVRSLKNPQEVAEFWDKVADACADLAQIPRERMKKERFVADVQISAGYMHAGYPIMTHLDTKRHVLDLEFLAREGSWGHFHEIGHNHQSDDWTFDGTVEVTVNLFTLYVYDEVLGMRPGDRRFRGEELKARAARFQAENWTFERWKEDPFMALSIYMQLQERFGWGKFKEVFAEYRKLPASERPRTDQEKRDQWMSRFSRAAGSDLSPLFSQWRIPVSEKASSSLRSLPPWR